MSTFVTRLNNDDFISANSVSGGGVISFPGLSTGTDTILSEAKTNVSILSKENKAINVMNSRVFTSKKPFKLEAGDTLPGIDITYTVHGEEGKKNKKVVWIIHALTANADPFEWWDGLVGPGKMFDPEKYVIICANNLGSCYGTTGPASTIPGTHNLYGKSFPLLTTRDMTKALDLLREHLKIEKIHVLIGGSMGGQISLEWAIMNPELVENLIPIATNARHSAWGIAFNEAQRLALHGNEFGLQAARAIALLSYRGYDAFEKAQTDTIEKIDYFRASSYQQYQGEKLAKRFDGHSYYTLSKAMDSHNVGRERGSIEKALSLIKAKTLVIGISSDILFPVREQKYLRDHIAGATLAVLESDYGHDGFLIEYEQLNKVIGEFLEVND